MSVGNYKPKQPLPMPTTAPAAKPTVTPAKTVVDAVEEGIRKDLDETQGVADRAMTYEDHLKEVGLTSAQATKILDAVLIDDHFSEVIKLTEKNTVTFRTRTYNDMVRYHQYLERYQPKYVTERDEIAMRYFLASSLEAFRGVTFDFPHPVREREAADKAFEVRHDFILSLGEPVVQRLSEELSKFDRRVYIAMNKGAVEFF